MEKKFVVKEFESQIYYCGEDYEWSAVIYLAHYFDKFADAENFIKRENGKFQIETVYVV